MITAATTGFQENLQLSEKTILHGQEYEKQIFRHCKKCKECVLQNQGQPEKCFGHFDSPDFTNGVHLHGLGGTYSPTQQQGKQVRVDGNRYANRILPLQ